MVESGNLNAGTLLTVVFAVMIGAFSLAMLGPRIETFAKATAAAQKIFQTLERIPSIDSLDDKGEKPDGVKGNLELKGVSFIYPARPEGSIILEFHFNASDCVEEYQHFHPGRKVHRHRRSFGIWEVDYPTIAGTIL
jgi:ABC-type multidrug transport system fused ATPase/permease subunit